MSLERSLWSLYQSIVSRVVLVPAVLPINPRWKQSKQIVAYARCLRITPRRSTRLFIFMRRRVICTNLFYRVIPIVTPREKGYSVFVLCQTNECPSRAFVPYSYDHNKDKNTKRFFIVKNTKHHSLVKSSVLALALASPFCRLALCSACMVSSLERSAS